MHEVIQKMLWAFLAVICVTATLYASDMGIHGMVTDSAGKPIRGAMVKARSGDKTVVRFTQADGRYEITLPQGIYDVAAEVYGFGPKTQTKDTTQVSDTNFILTPKFDLGRLTSAELETLLPDSQKQDSSRRHAARVIASALSG